MNNKEENWKEKIWLSTILKVDNVGVVLKQKNKEWFLLISGTKEMVVNITNVFNYAISQEISKAKQDVLNSIKEKIEGEKTPDTDEIIPEEVKKFYEGLNQGLSSAIDIINKEIENL